MAVDRWWSCNEAVEQCLERVPSVQVLLVSVDMHELSHCRAVMTDGLVAVTTAAMATDLLRNVLSAAEAAIHTSSASSSSSLY